MTSITATSSASPSLQATLSKVRLEQARQEADQAEKTAQDLRSQADAAEQEAQKGRERVQGLATSSRDATDATYTPQVRSARPEVSPQTQDFLIRMYKATSAKFAASGNALKTNLDSAPVVNALGQPTGRIVNIKA